jgi:cellulose synthase (UDP-forming)
MIRRPTARTVAFGGFVAATIAYLVWRALATRNPDAPVYSWVFLALEAYAAASAVTFYLITLRRADPEPRPPTPGRAVDVFICTYNEPAALLRQTIRRAVAMDYPHRTYVLDDGRRPEIRELATSLGAGYVTRERNLDYKAGNLNNALASTGGELIVVLDADHLVRRDFLTRLVGYFDEPDVAVVQTPQVFYNLDSFQHHFRPRRRRLWHEGAIFHHAMQPGANRWNAAFFVGTGAILRRRALETIGGFATGSVTEDAYTCMRLHAAGLRSVYHDEPLGYLVAPESLHQYLTQRLRWGQGSMQILRREHPLFEPGLTWQQRLVYTVALSSFAQAIVHLAYYLAPAVFLLGGPAPLAADDPLDFAPLLAHIGFDLLMFKLWLGPLARPLLSECYKFLNLYAFLKALGGYLRSSARLTFQVTTKGRDQGVSLRLLAPQAALLLINVTAFGHGVISLSTGGHPTIGWLGTSVATGFAGLFVLVGTMTFLFAHHRLAAASDYTFPDEIHGELEDGAAPTPALILRGNEAEMVALVARGWAGEVGAQVTLALALAPGEPPVRAPARVEAIERTPDGAVVRLALHDLSPAAGDRLFDRFVEEAVPRLLDPVVLGWTGRGPVTAPGGRFFLPVQPNVL